MAEINYQLRIEAPPENVFQALTTQDGIAGWWVTTNVMPGKVGGIAEFTFGSRYHNQMKIEKLDPTKFVQWHCLVGDKEWIGTDIVFELEEKNSQTNLSFVHTNWEAVTDFYDHCKQQWGKYLESLKKYCETGKGEPFTG